MLLALLPAIACAPDGDALDGGPRSTSDVVIDALRAIPSVVMAGTETQLTWATRNAAACTLSPGFGPVPRTGSVTALPAATTTYTLSCTGGGASASEEVTVEVREQAPVDSGPTLDGGPDADASVPDGGDLDGGGGDAGPLVFVTEDVEVAGAAATLAELEGLSSIFVIRERSDVTLAEDLPCDVHYPATYDDAFGATEPPCVVPAGAALESWLVHASPQDGGVLTGTVTFAREIVALQWRAESLVAGDPVVGRVELGYDDAIGRSFGVGFSDVITLADDRRTVSLTVNTTNADQVRVLTVADGADAPRVLSTTLAPHEAPPSLAAGAVESRDEALFVLERSLTLSQELAVDIEAPGQYIDPAQLTGGVIAAGTEVQSAFVHYDPPYLDAGTATLVVSGTLPSSILGFIALGPALNDTDAWLGAPDTVYETGGGRIIELTSDEIWLSADRKSFRLDLSVGGTSAGIDDLRILYAP